MLIAAVIVLGIVVLLGSGLATMYLSDVTATAPWHLAAVHGLIGLAGLGLLVLALQEPAPAAVNLGTASFGVTSAWLFALAAVFGATIFTRRWRKRRAGGLIAVHASLAVTAFVLLAAYAFVG